MNKAFGIGKFSPLSMRHGQTWMSGPDKSSHNVTAQAPRGWLHIEAHHDLKNKEVHITHVKPSLGTGGVPMTKARERQIHEHLFNTFPSAKVIHGNHLLHHPELSDRPKAQQKLPGSSAAAHGDPVFRQELGKKVAQEPKRPRSKPQAALPPHPGSTALARPSSMAPPRQAPERQPRRSLASYAHQYVGPKTALRVAHAQGALEGTARKLARKFRKSVGSGSGQRIKSGDWQHSMDGLDRLGHSAHARHHRQEFMVLRNQFLKADEEQHPMLLDAMRQLARHHRDHLLHKHTLMYPQRPPPASRAAPRLFLKGRKR